jgi:glucose dehydrogenase
MTKGSRNSISMEFRKSLTRTLGSKLIRAVALSLLFIVSGVGASVLMSPAAATPNSAAPSAAAPAAAQPAITQAEANWEYPNGNAFGQDYNPQTQINSSDVQYLGLSWIYPLPSLPTSLDNVESLQTAGVGVDPLIVNGTAIVILQYDEVLGFNVANGDVLWTFQTPLSANETLASGAGSITAHAHDGSEEYTTGTFASGVSGPTFWFEGGNARAYAIDAVNGKEELNFSTYTGLNMVAGNSPDATYSTLPASNIVISEQTGILVSSMGNGGAPSTGRSYFAGWNLNTNPPSLKWVTYDTPPQPFSGVPLNPNFDTELIANMTGAETFFPGENGSTNGYTTPTEVAGGVLVNNNDDIVVNWKSLSATELNATLYNDWGYSDQSAQCQAITGGDSTGSTNAGWGGQWLLGSGQTAGMVFVNTNNKDPYAYPCTPGPDLWSASELAINDSTGQLIWGFQANAHDLWDYDCSWSQEMGNETINGVNTEVIFKTCKNGYLYELNAVTGNLIWAWSPPSNTVTPGAARCPVCYMWNPLNESQMNFDYPSALTNCAPTFTAACISGPQPPFLAWPSEIAGFEDEQAFDPATNQIYATSHLVPYYTGYVPANASTYSGFGGAGIVTLPCPTCGSIANNATVWDINAATGNAVWSYGAAPLSFQGFRGQTDVSGNIVYLTMSSGDVIMLNAQTGKLVRDYYLGAPMDVGVAIGASVSGQEFVLVPVGTCSLEAVSTCPGSTPGDIIALTLTTPPPSTASTTTVTSTTTSVSTAVSTTTATASGQTVTVTTGANGQTTTVTMSGATQTVTSTTTSSSNNAALYGVAAVAVIFIIATGYLAMRGRKPGS